MYLKIVNILKETLFNQKNFVLIESGFLGAILNRIHKERLVFLISQNNYHKILTFGREIDFFK